MILISAASMLGLWLAVGSSEEPPDGISSPWEVVRDASGPTTLTLRYVYFVARRESAVGRVLSPRKTVALSELDRVEVNESESEVVIAVYVRATRTGRRAERVQAFPKEGRVKVRLNTPLGKRRLVHAQLHPDAEGQAEALRYVRRVPQGYGP